MGTGTWVRDSHWDRYLGMTAAMTQIPVPTAATTRADSTSADNPPTRVLRNRRLPYGDCWRT